VKKFLAYSVAAVLLGWSVIAVADNGASDDQTFPVSEWSERGVFVFSSLNFDFFYRRWSEGPFGGRLEDCSDDAMLCMNSDVFRLSLPRDCTVVENAKRGDTWGKPSAPQTEVYHIARSGVPPLHASGSDTNLYLGDPSAPNIVYQYDPKIGVTRILKDDPGGVDFAGMAKRGEIEGWLNGSATDRFKSSKIKKLATFDRFGVCGEMTPLRNLNVR